MTALRHSWLQTAAALLPLAWCAAASASALHESNNTPAKAFVLPAGQTSVSDDLNGAAGRPSTLLGYFGPAYGTPQAVNGSTAENPFVTSMNGVPLNKNGSVYFGVTGAPDTSFLKSHNQFGQYSVTFNVRDPAQNIVKTQTISEWIMPLNLNYVWLNPDALLPNWTGYTADVLVNNVVGPGTGDSLDYFQFTGLTPQQSYTVQLTNAQFNAKIGWFNEFNQFVAEGQMVGGVLSLTAIADPLGRLKIGVTGADDAPFNGSHHEVGTYTLSLVPEPHGVLLAGVGAALLGAYWKRSRRRRISP